MARESSGFRRHSWIWDFGCRVFRARGGGMVAMPRAIGGEIFVFVCRDPDARDDTAADCRAAVCGRMSSSDCGARCAGVGDAGPAECGGHRRGADGDGIGEQVVALESEARSFAALRMTTKSKSAGGTLALLTIYRGRRLSQVPVDERSWRRATRKLRRAAPQRSYRLRLRALRALQFPNRSRL
jgi:hypothetical protein